MNKKLIEGTHYSISQDGVVWNEIRKFEPNLLGSGLFVKLFNWCPIDINVVCFTLCSTCTACIS